MTAPAAPTLAEQAAQMRQRAEGMDRMLREASGEYTSKRRLQAIAIGAVSTLLMMYTSAADAMQEAADKQASDSGLIVPAEGLVLP